ncbi:MAG: ATP synthase F1 subunit epsilon [Lachnospiraceae bacterium]|nr:ATP synthase F1 subunit epsilon [Lachnospiraceae bacterium]
MASFFLKILACDKIFFQGHCESVVLPGIDGEYAFMAHHEEEIAAVAPGEMRFRLEDGTWRSAIVGGGIAAVANNRVNVLVQTAERPEDIDAVRAQEELERAQEAIRQKQSIHEYRITQASIVRAMSRLKKSKKNIV